MNSDVAMVLGALAETPRNNASTDYAGGNDDDEDGNFYAADGDEESDYSYTYDDDDEGQFTGYLIPTNLFETSDCFGSNYFVADDSTVFFDLGEANTSTKTVPETNPSDGERKQTYREPTRAAVNMSLRAEKEKTGGRRRLASDLYKIMTADTNEAGFSLQLSDDDSMDKLCIKLFGFDEDSILAKDLLVCGMDHVELEMTFPEQYPFESPLVSVVKPRFTRQTVASDAQCMKLLLKDGWNPTNDLESVIISIRNFMVVGQAATPPLQFPDPPSYPSPYSLASRLGGDTNTLNAGRKKAEQASADDDKANVQFLKVLLPKSGRVKEMIINDNDYQKKLAAILAEIFRSQVPTDWDRRKVVYTHALDVSLALASDEALGMLFGDKDSPESVLYWLLNFSLQAKDILKRPQPESGWSEEDVGDITLAAQVCEVADAALKIARRYHTRKPVKEMGLLALNERYQSHLGPLRFDTVDFLLNVCVMYLE
jgi:ubiquitin-protein ligase